MILCGGKTQQRCRAEASRHHTAAGEPEVITDVRVSDLDDTYDGEMHCNGQRASSIAGEDNSVSFSPSTRDGLVES